MKKLIVTCICLLSLTAWAGHGYKHGHKQGHSPAMMKEMLKQAGLSDQQIRRIETLHDGVEKQNLDLRHQLEKLDLEKEALMKNYQVDKPALFKLVEKIHALRLQKKKNYIEFKLNMRKEMTPEQFQKVRDLHTSMKAKHHGKHKGKHKGCGKGHHGHK